MEITNKYNLPLPLVEAVRQDLYSKGKSDISVTQLIDSPQMARLYEQHEHEIIEDASDRIYALMGSGTHNVLEQANVNDIAEERLFIEINGKTLSGAFDHLVLYTGLLDDYKQTSVWQVIYGNPKWETQLNCLAYLCIKNDYQINSLRIVAILRDWQKSKAKTDPGYPQHQVATINIPLWPLEKQEAYINERMAIHFQETVPECTDEDTWYSGDKWAVKKKGNKRATRVFDTEYEADQYIEEREGLAIEYREGVYRRCEDYCSVAEFCPQWKAIK